MLATLPLLRLLGCFKAHGTPSGLPWAHSLQLSSEVARTGSLCIKGDRRHCLRTVKVTRVTDTKVIMPKTSSFTTPIREEAYLQSFTLKPSGPKKSEAQNS